MAVEKIPIELDLKTAKALRNALGLEQAVGKVGDEAEDAGKQGASGFAAFGKSAVGVAAGLAGVGVGLAGVVGLMKQVHENQLAINAANAEAIRQQQARLKEAAFAIGSPLNRNLAQQLGVSEVDAFRQSGQLGAQFDLPQQQVAQTLLDIIPRTGGGAIGDVLTTARGTGMSGPAAGQLFSVLTEQFKLTGAPRREAAAQFAGVAQQSAVTPENLQRILTPVSAGLIQAGMDDPTEQAALAAAFAQFEDPNAPELTKTALKQLTRLTRMPADGFTRKLLRDIGADPETYTITDLVSAYQTFLQGGKSADEKRLRVRQLAQRTSIPPRVLDKIAFTAQSSFSRVYDKTLASGRRQTFSDVRSRAAQRISAPEAQTRIAAQRESMRTAVTGREPGGELEAARISLRLTSLVGMEDPEETEGRILQFQSRMRDVGLGDEERLSPDQARQLFLLLKVWSERVKPALEGVASSGNDIANAAKAKIVVGDHLAEEAQDWEIVGSQKNFYERFNVHIRDCIQFLRSIQLGKSFTREEAVSGGLGTTFTRDITTTPSAAQRASVAGTDIPPVTAGQVVNNISSQTNIINGADPATADTSNRGTGPAPGE